jgi:threonine aldolase
LNIGLKTMSTPRASAPTDSIHFDIDLRAEVLSRPTPAMWAAMQEAEIGWYGLEQDSNIAALEARVAALSGKEAAFFVVTGSLANLLAVMSLAERGTQIVMERRCHIYWHEENGVAYIMGLATRLVDGGRFGKMSTADLAEVLNEKYGYSQLTSLVCLENTHSISGGCVLSPQETSDLASVAKQHGAGSVYLDGARLWNAAVALDVPIKDLLDGVDAAMLSLSKSLGAPGGVVLVGSDEFVRSARLHAKRLGVYSLHRFGYFAAAGLVALDTMTHGLVEDHRRARALAVGLNAIDGLKVDLDTVQTNIVRAEVTREGFDGFAFVEALRRKGVGTRVIEPPRIVKFNTYSEITDDDIDAAIEAARQVLEH